MLISLSQSEIEMLQFAAELDVGVMIRYVTANHSFEKRKMKKGSRKRSQNCEGLLSCM